MVDNLQKALFSHQKVATTLAFPKCRDSRISAEWFATCFHKAQGPDSASLPNAYSRKDYRPTSKNHMTAYTHGSMINVLEFIRDHRIGKILARVVIATGVDGNPRGKIRKIP
jgi:hypothetical protein